LLNGFIEVRRHGDRAGKRIKTQLENPTNLTMKLALLRLEFSFIGLFSTRISSSFNYPHKT